MLKNYLLYTVLFLVCFSIQGKAQENMGPLKSGVIRTIQIQPNGKHSFTLDMNDPYWISGEIQQMGSNIALSVYDPNKELVLSQDLQKNMYTMEPFNFYAKEEGRYVLELENLEGIAVALPDDGNKFVWDGERRVPYETLFQKGAYAIRFEKRPKGRTLGQKIDELFWHYDRESYPGAAIAVVKNGALLYEKGYGEANLEYGIPVTPQTVFHIASISKQFAGFALATLHKKGELSLDDDIHLYIPELSFEEKVTLRQMLNHTSGIRDQWVLMALSGWRMDDVITQDQLLRMIYRQKGLNFKPGEDYRYSNSNYTLAAEVVRRVTGKTLRQWTTDNLFAPLGMEHTFFYDDHEEIVPKRAYSYDDRSGSLKKSNLNFANMGATSLFTTVDDFSKWLIEFKEHRVVDADIFDLVIEKGQLNNGEQTHYGLGLASGAYKGHPVIDHSGVDAGYRSFMMYFPEEELGIIILSNVASCNVIDLAMNVADICLGIPDMPEQLNRKEQSPKSNGIAMAPNQLDAYVGTYNNPEVDVKYQFTVKDGRLMASHKRLEDIGFLPLDKDRFKGDYWIFHQVEFIRKAGEVTGFKVTNGGVDELIFNKE